MSILCAGLSHRTASFEALSEVSFASYQLAEFLRELREAPGVLEAAALATCNRLEIYAVTDPSEDAAPAVLRALADNRGVEPATLQRDAFFLHSGEAIRHLFRVACGTDSMIVGEYEILGQVRRALELARGVGSCGPALEKFFEASIAAGRKARQQTAISRGSLSVAGEAVALAGERLGSLRGRKALVIGSGEIGELTAKALVKGGVSTLLIGNRTLDNARALAEEIGCTAVPMEDITRQTADSDLVVCATGAPHHILTASMVEAVMAARRERPLALLDLSVPRNIEPRAGGIPGVHLLTIESLRQGAEENRERRLGEIAMVEQIVESEAAAFERVHNRRHAQDFASRMRQDMEAIRRRHLARYGKQFPEDCHPQLDRLTRSILSQVLHKLTVNLRDLDLQTTEGRRMFEIACRLFDVAQPTEEIHRGKDAAPPDEQAG